METEQMQGVLEDRSHAREVIHDHDSDVSSLSVLCIHSSAPGSNLRP